MSAVISLQPALRDVEYEQPENGVCSIRHAWARVPQEPTGAEREALKAEGRRLREEGAALEAKSGEIVAEADAILKAIPNLTHPAAPVGGEDAAVEIDLASGQMTGVSVADSLLVDVGALRRREGSLDRLGCRGLVVRQGVRVSLPSLLAAAPRVAVDAPAVVREVPVAEPGHVVHHVDVDAPSRVNEVVPPSTLNLRRLGVVALLRFSEHPIASLEFVG